MLHMLLKTVTIDHECLSATWNILSQLGSLNLPGEIFNRPVRTYLLVLSLVCPDAICSGRGTVLCLS